MKWLSQKEIKERAKKSKREAIKVSWEHWEQLAICTENQLRSGIKQGRVSKYAKHCGLCRRYILPTGTCKKCPIGPVLCCAEYSKAGKALRNWWKEPSKSRFLLFQKAARVMANKLKRLLKKQ